MGGGQSFVMGVSFLFPSFTVCDTFAAERIREKVLLILYIYNRCYICICIQSCIV